MFSVCNWFHFILLNLAAVEMSFQKTPSVIPEQSFRCNVNKSSQKHVFDGVGNTTQNFCRKMEHFGSKDDGRRVCLDDVDPFEEFIVQWPTYTLRGACLRLHNGICSSFSISILWFAYQVSQSIHWNKIRRIFPDMGRYCRDMEPFYFEEPWWQHLRNKIVLAVHPFV